jgi:hypothetical protein
VRINATSDGLTGISLVAFSSFTMIVHGEQGWAVPRPVEDGTLRMSEHQPAAGRWRPALVLL